MSILLKLKYVQNAGKSLARQGRKQANISVRMAWISFGVLPCRGRKNLMTARVSILLKSRASLHASQLVSFLVGLRTYQHPGICKDTFKTQHNICQPPCELDCRVNKDVNPVIWGDCINMHNQLSSEKKCRYWKTTSNSMYSISTPTLCSPITEKPSYLSTYTYVKFDIH